MLSLSDVAKVGRSFRAGFTRNSVETTLISVFASSDPERSNPDVVYRKNGNSNRIFYAGNIYEYAYIYTTVKTFIINVWTQ